MTETSIKKTSVLEAFLKQREKRQNDTGIQAQKLVNLYRHLALFGDDFLATYNKMLLETSPEVQLALSDVMGGTVVRQYLDFLKTKQQKPEEEQGLEEKVSYVLEESYLPSPDTVQPYQTGAATVGIPVGDSGNSEAALKSQSVFLEQALSKQTDFLGQALTQMQENIAKQKVVVQAPSDVEKISSEDFKLTIEKIFEKQNQVLIESLKQVFDNSAEVTSKQMETFERVLKDNKAYSETVYPEIEEYTPETYTIQNDIKKVPAPPRAYHPIKPEEIERSPIDTIIQESSDEPIEQSVRVSRPKDISSVPSEDVEILSEIDLPTETL